MATKVHEGNAYKKIAKHGSWYVLASLVTKGSGFLLLPIYTKYLTPTDYGIIGTLESFGQILPLIISLMLDGAFIRYYYVEREASHERVVRLFSTHFWFVIVWGGVFVAGSALPIYFLISKYDDSLSFFPYVPLTILPPLFTQLAALGNGVFEANLQAKQTSVIKLLAYFSSIAVTLYLMISLNLGVIAKLSGTLVFPMIMAIIYVTYSIQQGWVKPIFDIAILKRSVTYSIPLLPSAAAAWIYTISDRLILAEYGTLAEVGLYTLAFQCAQILYVLSDAMGRVSSTVMMSSLTADVEQGTNVIRGYLSFFIWVMLGLSLGFCFFTEEVIVLFTDKQFHEIHYYVWMLALPYIFGGVYRHFSIIVGFYAKTWVFSAATLVSATVNGILNFIWIPEYGQLAAALSTIGASVIHAGIIIFFANRLLQIHPNWRMILPSVFTALLCLYGYWQATVYLGDSPWLYIGAKIAILAGYGLITLSSPAIRESVQTKVSSYLQNRAS